MASLYSERLLEHFRNPRHAGLLEAPAATVTVENPACGDLMKLSVRIEGGAVVQAGFQVRGCTASIAAGSALAEWLTGREVQSISREAAAAAVEVSLGGLPEASRHVLTLCADAIAAVAALNPR
jgi:nitrogen fixation protein NifU and related proteins